MPAAAVSTDSMFAPVTKRSYLAPDPPTNAISITLASEDKEILRWPEDSTAIMLLWYGLVETQEIVFLWAIQQLRQLAEIEAGGGLRVVIKL